RQSLGLFLTPMTRDLGIAAADFTLAIAMQNIVWGLSQAPVGAVADRFGLRITLIVGAAIYVVGLAIMALAGGVVALLVSGAFIGIALSCTASSLAMTATARAVSEERRSKTLGIVSAAGSLGTLLVPLATQAILAHEAWQLGVLFFVAMALVMLPAGFWAGGADYLPGRGATRTSMREMLGLLYILRAAVFTAYFMMPPTPASTLVFAAAMGMLWLSVAPLVSGLVAEMFGTRYMATLLGISFVLHQVGSSLGAFGGGLIFD